MTTNKTINNVVVDDELTLIIEEKLAEDYIHQIKEIKGYGMCICLMCNEIIESDNKEEHAGNHAFQRRRGIMLALKFKKESILNLLESLKFKKGQFRVNKEQTESYNLALDQAMSKIEELEHKKQKEVEGWS